MWIAQARAGRPIGERCRSELPRRWPLLRDHVRELLLLDPDLRLDHVHQDLPRGSDLRVPYFGHRLRQLAEFRSEVVDPVLDQVGGRVRGLAELLRAVREVGVDERLRPPLCLGRVRSGVRELENVRVDRDREREWRVRTTRPATHLQPQLSSRCSRPWSKPPPASRSTSSPTPGPRPKSSGESKITLPVDVNVGGWVARRPEPRSTSRRARSQTINGAPRAEPQTGRRATSSLGAWSSVRSSSRSDTRSSFRCRRSGTPPGGRRVPRTNEAKRTRERSRGEDEQFEEATLPFASYLPRTRRLPTIRILKRVRPPSCARS